MIAWKGGGNILFPWVPGPTSTDPRAKSWHHRYGCEGSGKQGGGGGPHELGSLFIILQIISPSWPKIAQIILSVHLSFLRSLCQGYFAEATVSSCWREPCEIAMLLPAFWSSFLQVKEARLTLFGVCLRVLLGWTPHPGPEWATVPVRGLLTAPQHRAPLPASQYLLPCSQAPWGLHSKMPVGHQNPSPFSAVTRCDSGWWRGRALRKCAEILQGIPCATGLTRSVLFEDLAILVPNKEIVGAGQGVQLAEVEDQCWSCKFAGPFLQSITYIISWCRGILSYFREAKKERPKSCNFPDLDRTTDGIQK